MLTIDGSQGEGGGQILRTSLALAAVTQTPITIENVRAKRSRGGLLRQHLTGLEAIRDICTANVEGAVLGSRRIVFRPGAIQSGNYRFSVGTAGSACLVFQTVIYPLLFASGPSVVVIEGGTHNSHAPPFDFIARTFLPILARMGADVQPRIERHGFYPAGGGRIVVEIAPCPALTPIELLEPGAVHARRARAVVARLPDHIAERELALLCQRLGLAEADCEVVKVRSNGPGNALVLHIERATLTETITSFGEKGVRAEAVATAAADEADRYLAASVPVGEHLADQLLIPLALAGAGAFRTLPLSPHATTNIDVVERLLGKRPRVVGDGAAVVVEL